MTDGDGSNIREADAAAISEAAALLRDGKLVAFPTETVYGLGADALNARAVAAIFAVKRRPRINPLIVHVRDVEQAAEYVVFSGLARELAVAFWPGALTLVLPRHPETCLPLLASAGLDTLAVRAPSHPIARRLLAEAGLPIAAPSANVSGEVSPTRAAHVAAGLGDKVDMILDGGPTPLGIESTVVGFADRPVLLRPGSVPRDRIERIAGPLAAPSDGRAGSPGRLPSHYAPRARLRLNARAAEPDEALLAFGPDVPESAPHTLNLSRSGDLAEAAANLFAMLRALDAENDAIAVMPIPSAGLGEAINDRLARAAAPRSSPS